MADLFRKTMEQRNYLIQEDFVEILPERLETQHFYIPREQWSKTNVCFPESD